MSYLDAWIVCTPYSVVTVAAENGGNGTRQYHNSAVVTGHWKPAGAREVYNICVTKAQLDAYVDALNAADPGSVSAVYAWTQGDGLDSLDAPEYLTVPDEVLALMRDHVTYDENGNETSRTPATAENPNWGHVFLGQKQRIFAGQFSDEFSEEFF